MKTLAVAGVVIGALSIAPALVRADTTRSTFVVSVTVRDACSTDVEPSATRGASVTSGCSSGGWAKVMMDADGAVRVGDLPGTGAPVRVSSVFVARDARHPSARTELVTLIY